MSDTKDEHEKSHVFQGADYAVISNPVLPQSAQGALKPCSYLSWIVQLFDAVAEKIEDSSRDRLI
jgi:hypothetical protein